MNTYTPDRWVIIKITSPEYETIYKVLAGWYGGFAGSDSWKINSGITKIVESADNYEVYGYSSSVYTLYKGADGFSGLMFNTFERLKSQLPYTCTLEVVDIESIVLDSSAEEQPN
jgi:hypothetical protein